MTSRRAQFDISIGSDGLCSIAIRSPRDIEESRYGTLISDEDIGFPVRELSDLTLATLSRAYEAGLLHGAEQAIDGVLAAGCRARSSRSAPKYPTFDPSKVQVRDEKGKTMSLKTARREATTPPPRSES